MSFTITDTSDSQALRLNGKTDDEIKIAKFNALENLDARVAIEHLQSLQTSLHTNGQVKSGALRILHTTKLDKNLKLKTVGSFKTWWTRKLGIGGLRADWDTDTKTALRHLLKAAGASDILLEEVDQHRVQIDARQTVAWINRAQHDAQKRLEAQGSWDEMKQGLWGGHQQVRPIHANPPGLLHVTADAREGHYNILRAVDHDSDECSEPRFSQQLHTFVDLFQDVDAKRADVKANARGRWMSIDDPERMAEQIKAECLVPDWNAGDTLVDKSDLGHPVSYRVTAKEQGRFILQLTVQEPVASHPTEASEVPSQQDCSLQVDSPDQIEMGVRFLCSCLQFREKDEANGSGVTDLLLDEKFGLPVAGHELETAVDNAVDHIMQEARIENEPPERELKEHMRRCVLEVMGQRAEYAAIDELGTAGWDVLRDVNRPIVNYPTDEEEKLKRLQEYHRFHAWARQSGNGIIQKMQNVIAARKAGLLERR